MAIAQDIEESLHLSPQDWSWRFWFTVPLYPYRKRRTLRQEVVADRVWTFDQLQGIFYVTVPIRMTVIKLDAGGLLVYAPIAPTVECIRLVKELGEVEYIILPTVSGIEHKVFVGPFARCFPQAQVFVAPNQWSFPINLPLSWLGFPAKRTQILPEDSRQAPFAAEVDYAILTIGLGRRTFGEVAMVHRRSRTLLVTDSIVAVSEQPPEIVQLDPYPLLFHARDSARDRIQDSEENRRKGWQRLVLFTFYFRPSVLDTIELPQAFQEARQAPDRSAKAYFGLFPFQWRSNWLQSFQALRSGGLRVAPILQTLIMNRAPQETIAWANRVAGWDFERIIPAHLDSPVAATPAQFRQAFAFLERRSGDQENVLLRADSDFLRTIEAGLFKWGIVPPAKEKL